MKQNGEDKKAHTADSVMGMREIPKNFNISQKKKATEKLYQQKHNATKCNGNKFTK